MKRIWSVILLLAAIGLLVWGYDFWALRNLRGEAVVAKSSEYAAEDVLLRVYAGHEAPATRWLLLGTDDSRVAIIVEAPPARGIYLGPNYSSVRHDGPFEIRIFRKRLGFLWLPHATVTFDVAPDSLPYLTRANEPALWQDLRAALAGR